MSDRTGIGEKAPGCDRMGDWCWTHMNKQFYPLDPRPEDVDVRDIFWALSHQCRFGGHTSEFYSVLEHSILVGGLAALPEVNGHVTDPAVTMMLYFLGLFHDATEAYLVDLPRPVKLSMPQYKEAENRLAGVIGESLGLGKNLMDLPPAVKLADNLALAIEARHFCGNPQNWHLPDLKPYPAASVCRPLVQGSPRYARNLAYRRYRLLVKDIFGDGEHTNKLLAMSEEAMDG